ncbi:MULTISPECIES: hypothetical protein [Halomonas]|uniref:SPOR domain-containing protein n=2 Tax=Halomonas TaxID=2745 RepID=A0A2N7TVJ7_9GAMM|nr:MULTISPECIES: hypothetical protein [Halomonas]MDI5935759.1 hypothetical protein [Halomonas kalidii]PMR72197.1 hypothetical protein C1H66_00710 [Halomonas heilongjiangensis]PXX91448.1 hypothetical protein CR158_08070 [Halomonas heilongjiangensis]
MTQTVTAAYGSAMKATNAYDELVSEGFPREKLYLDKETNQVKVIIPDTSKPEAEEILRRHGPDEFWSRPFEG